MASTAGAKKDKEIIQASINVQYTGWTVGDGNGDENPPFTVYRFSNPTMDTPLASR